MLFQVLPMDKMPLMLYLCLIQGRSFGDEYSALLSLFKIADSPKLKGPKNAVCKI